MADTARPAAGGNNTLSIAALVALVAVAAIYSTSGGSKAAGSAYHAPAPTFAAPAPTAAPAPPSTADVV
jgi:hypothetical protein